MGKKSGPKQPDPYKVSAAQTKSNKETAEYEAALNRINQSGPFGSVNYSITGKDPTTGAPIYSQSTNLSPELQELFDAQTGAQQGISSAITGALGRMPTDPFNPNIDTSQVAKTSFDRQMGLLQPKFDEESRNLEVRMSERGIPIGAEVHNNEVGRFDRARNEAVTQAARTADMDALNEHQRQYGNALTEYNLPLQQLSTLMGNSQSVGNPQFSNFATSNMNPTDVSGNVWNAYKADVDRHNAQQSNLFGGLLGLGKLGMGAFQGGGASAAAGMASMFSDIRLKRDIRRIGALPSGLPVYEYGYVWGGPRQLGVMAHEAAELFPDAVSVHGSGYAMVRYDLIG